MIKLEASNIELEKQNADLTGQLHRRESNMIQAIQGDFSAEREDLKAKLVELKNDAARAKTAMLYVPAAAPLSP